MVNNNHEGSMVHDAVSFTKYVMSIMVSLLSGIGLFSLSSMMGNSFWTGMSFTLLVSILVLLYMLSSSEVW